jgi:hypothetical protein
MNSIVKITIKGEYIMLNKLEQDLNIKLTDREKMILNYYDKLLTDKESKSNSIITKTIKRSYNQMPLDKVLKLIEFAKNHNVGGTWQLADVQKFMFSPADYIYLIDLTGKEKDIELVEQCFR